MSGVARGVNARTEPNWLSGQNASILTFRVNEFDPEGDLVWQTIVELRGMINGQVLDGDQVRLDGKWRRGLVVTDQVEIFRDGRVIGVVSASSTVSPWQIVIAVIMVLAFIAFAIFAYNRVSNSGGPSALPTPPTEPSLSTVTFTTTDTTTTTEPPTTTETTTTALETAQIECAPTGASSSGVEPGPYVSAVPDQEVQWTNGSSQPMDLGITDPPPNFVPTRLQPGEDYSLAFGDPATYEYQCVFSTIKVVGKVTVEVA